MHLYIVRHILSLVSGCMLVSCMLAPSEGMTTGGRKRLKAGSLFVSLISHLSGKRETKGIPSRGSLIPYLVVCDVDFLDHRGWLIPGLAIY